MEMEIFDIIARVLGDNASAKDRQMLTDWLNQDQDHVKIFKQIESVWNALEILRTGKEYDTDNAFDQFKEKTNRLGFNIAKGRFRKTIDVILRIAAIMIILAGISFLLFKPETSNLEVRAPMVENNDTTLCEVIAPRGSKAQLILHDGTKVWLNADSKFSYRKDFNNQNRETYLEGEGYFEVSENPDKPFIVNTSHIKIKALGTSFNVRSYADENTVETTLIEGKVELELKSADGSEIKPIKLEQNQEAIFYKDGELSEDQQSATNNNTRQKDIPLDIVRRQLTIEENFNTDLKTCWKNNVLYFDDEPFQDLAIKLERRFGITIHLMDEDIKKIHFTGTFDDYIIEQVLEALKYASPFYYVLNEKNIYISSKPMDGISSNINPG